MVGKLSSIIEYQCLYKVFQWVEEKGNETLMMPQ
jgi:hypothetical protein